MLVPFGFYESPNQQTTRKRQREIRERTPMQEQEE